MNVLSHSGHEEQAASIAVNYSRLMARQLQLQEKDLWRLLRGSGLTVQELMDDNGSVANLVARDCGNIIVNPEYQLPGN
jgi:hypothetical protein